MRDVEGWPPEEVCDVLDLSEGNQRVLLHRARSRVRAELERYFADDPVAVMSQDHRPAPATSSSSSSPPTSRTRCRPPSATRFDAHLDRAAPTASSTSPSSAARSPPIGLAAPELETPPAVGELLRVFRDWKRGALPRSC